MKKSINAQLNSHRHSLSSSLGLLIAIYPAPPRVLLEIFNVGNEIPMYLKRIVSTQVLQM